MNSTFKEFLILISIIIIILFTGYEIINYFNHKKEIKNNESKSIHDVSFELKLKKLIKSQIENEEKVITDQTVINAVEKIRKRLVSNIKNNPYNIEIIVIDSPLVNSVCLPGGLIVVYSGMIKLTGNPEELAGVMAHEMGHVENRDSYNALLREFGFAIILTVISGGNPNTIEKIVKSLISNKFSREIEKRADEFACNLLIQSRINPIHLADVFKKFKEKEINSSNQKFLVYLSNHPDTESRIIEVENKAKHFKGNEEKLNINWPAVKAKLK